MKVAKMCARKAGLPDEGVISLGALRHALDIYFQLPGTKTVYIRGQNNDEIQLNYSYETGLLNLWTADDDDAGVNLNETQVKELIKALNKIHLGMLHIKVNNLQSELVGEALVQEPRFNCDCC